MAQTSIIRSSHVGQRLGRLGRGSSGRRRPATAAEAREFAVQMEEYEAATLIWEVESAEYRNTYSARSREFVEDLKELFSSLNDDQFDLVYNYAYEQGHSEEYHIMYAKFVSFAIRLWRCWTPSEVKGNINVKRQV